VTEDRAFHVVIRSGRDVRMTTVHNSTDEAEARAAYQVHVNQATAWPAGGKVELRDRVGRVMAAYLSTARETDTPDRRRKANNEDWMRPQQNRRTRR
jgi:hypothetical protein